jgi:MFS family permease
VLRLALTLFLVQAGYHSFTASVPVALTGAGVPDPTIGLVVGAAALVQLPAAFVAGALVDRYGGFRFLFVGVAAYLSGCVILALPSTDPAGSLVPFVAARMLQGIGIAGSLPAALSLVPRLVPDARRALGLAFINSAHNLGIVVLPPVSLAVLAALSIHAVAAGTIVLVLIGASVLFTLPETIRAPVARPAGTRRRGRFGLSVRRAWAAPLAIPLLYVIHWGVLTAYLPSRAERAGADIGIFFAADGVAVLASRLPVGWLTDRVASRTLILLGLFITSGALVLAVLPVTTLDLALAGVCTGLGAGLALTPNLVELARRSDDHDRGSAFALFSAGLAGGMILGTIVAAPVVAVFGFQGAAIGALLGMVGAALVVTRDRAMGVAGSGGEAGGAPSGAELNAEPDDGTPPGMGSGGPAA